MNAQLEKLKIAIDRAIEGMSAEDLCKSPQGKWSAAEVLEHLSLTYSGTVRGFEKCLQAGHPLATPIVLKQRLAILLVTRFGYLPSGRDAPATTRPKGTPAQQIANEIGRRVEEMDLAIAACENRYGGKVRLLNHPILGPLTADQWRRFHWVHGKHHLKQIEAIRKAG
jgi:Protein of unknown function (DUF1569)